MLYSFLDLKTLFFINGSNDLTTAKHMGTHKDTTFPIITNIYRLFKIKINTKIANYKKKIVPLLSIPLTVKANNKTAYHKNCIYKIS